MAEEILPGLLDSNRSPERDCGICCVAGLIFAGTDQAAFRFRLSCKTHIPGCAVTRRVKPRKYLCP